jgi:hypothetical protein
MSWANKVHMEQLAWMLRHHIGEGSMGSNYHLSMLARSCNTLKFSNLGMLIGK